MVLLSWSAIIFIGATCYVWKTHSDLTIPNTIPDCLLLSQLSPKISPGFYLQDFSFEDAFATWKAPNVI